MDKKMLQDAFREYKKATVAAGVGVDFSISRPASFYSSTVACDIRDKYGHDATGVWANRSEDLAKDDYIYVNHDINDAQVGIFYEVFGKYYNILPLQEDYAAGWAFQLFEKSTPVWVVAYVNEHDVRVSDTYTDGGAALKWLDRLFKGEWAKSPTLTRQF